MGKYAALGRPIYARQFSELNMRGTITPAASLKNTSPPLIPAPVISNLIFFYA